MSAGVSFVRQSLRRISARVRPKDLDPKKLGVMGAPVCRCTSLVLALCIALTGLVVTGLGACMAAFMWHDDKAKGLGLALVGLGLAMLVAGSGLCIYDQYFRPVTPPRNQTVVYQQGATRVAATPLGVGQAASTITNVHTMPSNGGQARRPAPTSAGPAPPPYDAVCEEDVRRRASQDRTDPCSSPVDGRGSYRSAVRHVRTTATVV